MGAIVAAFFPETRNCELTMTYEEAEDFFRKALKDSKVPKLFGLPKYRYVLAVCKCRSTFVETINRR